MARVRNRAITIRLTEKEYKLLGEKVEMSGLTQQSFVINAVMGAVLYGKDGMNYLEEIRNDVASFVEQVRGIATNINQMARIANANKETITESKLLKLKSDFDLIKKEGDEIWRSLRLLMAHQKVVPEHVSA